MATSLPVAPSTPSSVVTKRLGTSFGFAALAVTVLIWAGFFLSLRAGAKANLSPDALALLRFGPAGFVFLPILVQRWERIAAVPLRHLISMVVGCGLPYFLIAGMAMRHAPVSDCSTLIPGTLPLFVAGISALFYGQKLAAGRGKALLLIGIGAGLMLVFNHGDGEVWQGYVLFLVGSLLWANFTVSLRQSGLTPLEGAALISTASLGMLLLWLLEYPPIGLLALSWHEMCFIGLVQGIGVGILSTLCYAFAVTKLGASQATAAGALTPVLASLLAVPLFGEVPGLSSMAGMALIIVGVVLASRS
ncbi:DMT family transporter [Chitinimonas sp. PSY-7]|uniref:EamA family transporter n=1 Tax=Chitinimonas sp. PSY-7 TaxID=3459088 RepID=UPI00404028FC